MIQSFLETLAYDMGNFPSSQTSMLTAELTHQGAVASLGALIRISEQLESAEKVVKAARLFKTTEIWQRKQTARMHPLTLAAHENLAEAISKWDTLTDE